MTLAITAAINSINAPKLRGIFSFFQILVLNEQVVLELQNKPFLMNPSPDQ